MTMRLTIPEGRALDVPRTIRDLRTIAIAVVATLALPAAVSAETGKGRGSRDAAQTLAFDRSTPLVGVVSLRRQRITIFSGATPVDSAPISSGKEGHRTPKGVFSILQKNRWHESNIYSGAEMPFMQRLTWSGIALHAGQLPGYPASHGCVRLPMSFAERLFTMTRMGGRFIVADDLPSPQVVAHDRLPVPVYGRDSGGVSASPAGLAQGGLLVASAQAAPAGFGTLLNPLQMAERKKESTRARAAEALQTAEELRHIATVAAELHREARADLVEAERAIEAARRTVDLRRGRVLATVPDSEERTQADASLWVAEEALADAEKEKEAAARYEQTTAEDAMAAAQAAKTAFADHDQAEAEARTASRGFEPVSVLISRKTRRLYVRQGFEPVLEATVDFVAEDTPIGTHVFTAVGLGSNRTALEWTVVSLPDAGVGGVPNTAREALDRIAIEPDVVQFIGERAWIGASVTISDHAPSHETGKGTDFVVLTK